MCIHVYISLFTYALLPILCPSQWESQARVRLHQLTTVAGSPICIDEYIRTYIDIYTCIYRYIDT